MPYDLEAEKRALEKRQLDKENTYMGAVKNRISELAGKLNPANDSAAGALKGRGAAIDGAVDDAVALGQHGQADRAHYNWTK